MLFRNINKVFYKQRKINSTICVITKALLGVNGYKYSTLPKVRVKS